MRTAGAALDARARGSSPMAGEPGALWGTFSEPGSLAVGDNYIKPPGERMYWAGYGQQLLSTARVVVSAKLHMHVAGRLRVDAPNSASFNRQRLKIPLPPPHNTPPMSATKLPRHSGKQFSTVAPKSGKAPDAYLDKAVRSLGEGAPYVDAWILDKRLSRIPGKAVKPFVTLVGRRSCIRCGDTGNVGGAWQKPPLLRLLARSRAPV